MSADPRISLDTLSSAEVCAALGRRDDTLYKLVQKGELPAYRVARKLRFKAVDVARFLERHREVPQADGDIDNGRLLKLVSGCGGEGR